MTWFAVCDVDGCGLAVHWDDDEEMDTWRRIVGHLDGLGGRSGWSPMRERHYCPDHLEADDDAV